MEAMAVVICCLNSGRDCGRGWGTLSLMYSDKMKDGVKSGDLGGHLHHMTSSAGKVRFQVVPNSHVEMRRRPILLEDIFVRILFHLL
jgi:hypothetical protein